MHKSLLKLNIDWPNCISSPQTKFSNSPVNQGYQAWKWWAWLNLKDDDSLVAWQNPSLEISMLGNNIINAYACGFTHEFHLLNHEASIVLYIEWSF